MKKRLTSTEVARRFADVLAEVRHGREPIVVTRSGRPVAEIQPLEKEKRCTLEQFAKAWRDPRAAADTFADDLDKVNQSDRLPRNPWESS